VLTAKSVLQNEVFRDNTRIQAILFSGARTVPKDQMQQASDVVVIDADRIEKILALAAAGQQSTVLSYFENPSWPLFQ
jgi:hypothetical protein